MVDGIALSIRAADARTWILTLVTYARLIRWTVGAKHAFGSATLIGISLVFINALAGGGSIAFNALSIGATWRWLARLRLLNTLLHALHECVAGITWWAGAGN